MVLLRNIRLGTITNEQRVDALLDTGATYCVVPASVAFSLGFNEGNRLGKQAVNVVGGRIEMDLHKLEYVRAGTAQVYRVSLRDRAHKQNRTEGELLEEIVRSYLVVAPRWSGSLNEFFGRLERRRRDAGVVPLSEDEATSLANDELHAMRRERKEAP